MKNGVGVQVYNCPTLGRNDLHSPHEPMCPWRPTNAGFTKKEKFNTRMGKEMVSNVSRIHGLMPSSCKTFETVASPFHFLARLTPEEAAAESSLRFLPPKRAGAGARLTLTGFCCFGFFSTLERAGGDGALTGF